RSQREGSRTVRQGSRCAARLGGQGKGKWSRRICCSHIVEAKFATERGRQNLRTKVCETANGRVFCSGGGKREAGRNHCTQASKLAIFKIWCQTRWEARDHSADQAR